MRVLTILGIAALVMTSCGGTPAASNAPATSAAASTANATPTTDAVAEFYKGKTVKVIVGYSAGGGYDTYARVLAAHIGDHIPGKPTVIVENMAGAGSMKSANYLFGAAPKDGTEFGIFGRGLPANELTGQPEAQFKSTQFNWVGSMNNEVSVCIARSDSKIKKFEDLYTTPMKVGATGPDDDTGSFPRILNDLLGTKFELVTGYPGGNDVNLAIERGEVEGRCGFSYSSLKSTKAQWMKDKFITILTQMSVAKHPELPDVPLVTDFAKDKPDALQILKVVFSRQAMGRPFTLPPGVPQARVDAIRKAFMDTISDPAFKADAEKQKLEVNAKSGTEVQDIVTEIFKTPDNLKQKLADILKSSS
jgi:tripartite-type tricarboxylate transporter receptor subunit TctC